MNNNKIEAIKTAREIVELKPVYLDTETTGLGNEAQIVDIAIVDWDGTELLNTLIRPTIPIPSEASAIHGIQNEDIIDAPSFGEVSDNLRVYNHRLIIIYNRDYDLRLCAQSAKVHSVIWAPPETICAMELYAQFYGDWNEYHGNYKWQSQANAAKQLGVEIPEDLHRATADANLCRLIVEAMAATPLPGEATQESQLFIESFNSLAEHAHEMAKRKGFWAKGGRDDGELFMLLVTELAEAYEALRSGNPRSKKITGFSSVEEEVADFFIRAMDAFVARGWQVPEAIIAKMAYNESRPYKHGKKF